MTLYELLGLSPNASPEQIHQAYRQLAKTAHPDVGGDPEKFRALDDAHKILMDPAARAHYDKTGQAIIPQADNEIAELLMNASGAFDDTRRDVEKNGERIEQVDMVQRMIGVIRRRQQELAAAAQEAERIASTFEPIFGRFTPKVSGANLLDEMLRGKQRQAKEFVENTNRQIAVLEKTAAFVSGFTYRADPVQIGRPILRANPWQNAALDFQAQVYGEQASTTTTGRRT